MSIEELDWLRTLATRLAVGGDEDDLVQETVLAAWRTNPEVSSDRPLRPWLGAVARNHARMNARARSRREQREHCAAEVITPSAAVRPDDELARVRALQAVCAALDELPELDRRIIIRRFVDEENATQIGERLGIPAATVRSRLRRSLAQLRSTLDARHGGWALALVGPMPRGQATASSVGLGAKLGFTLTIGVGSAVLWSSCDREDEREQAAAVVTEQAASEQPSEPSPELSERERWEQRRAQIRAALAERSANEHGDAASSNDDATAELTAEALEQVRYETVARAWTEFRDLKRACVEDLGSDANGAITVSAVVIGDPQIGTIFDSVEIVTETVGDPEVIACVREAMYAYAGEPPPVPVESLFVRTMPWIGRIDDDDRNERRIFDTIVGAHHGEIAACQRGDAFVGPGNALIEFTVDGDKLAEPRVLKTDLPEEVVDCIVTASLQWPFPKLLSGKMFWYEFKLPVEGMDRILDKTAK